ncbi:MAG TPA: GAF domain-containing protein, partial [Sporichthya sp.]|nr:GAF domain-containing protein [Sporichthya sp.]
MNRCTSAATRRTVPTLAAGSARTAERELAGLVRRCYAGLGADDLRREIAGGLSRVLHVDAAFVATVDPATILMTGVVTDGTLGPESLRFLDNELRGADVNTFAALAADLDHVQTLDRATAGTRSTSPRYTEILAPLGLGDELRAALTTGTHCWGVVCLHRADGPTGFDERELGMLRRLVPHLGEGLRRAVARDLGAQAVERDGGPGMLVLSEDLEIVSATAAAQAWLGELEAESWSA